MTAQMEIYRQNINKISVVHPLRRVGSLALVIRLRDVSGILEGNEGGFKFSNLQIFHSIVLSNQQNNIFIQK